jgi:hypothetical protein
MDSRETVEEQRALWSVGSLFVPLLLVVVTLVVWSGFQTVQLIRERANLRTLKANQEAPVQESLKLRAQLDSIAKRTAELAAQGNAGATTIVEALAKRGITINPNAPPAK